MRPEDIDKLFKERLGNTSPTPPGDLWSRLQDRIEDEMPAPQQEPARKRGFMWVYSSIAASLALLLAVGVVLFNVKHNQVALDRSVAQQELNELPQPTVKPAFTPQVVKPEQTSPATIAKATETEAENNLPTQATKPTPAASNSTKAIATNTKVQHKPVTVMKKASTTKAIPDQPAADASAIAAIQPTEKPAAAATSVTVTPDVKPVTPSALAVVATKAGSAEPVEIIIKRAVDTHPVVAQAEADEPTGLEKKARLAKNIFKQVRNLSNGEPMELSDLGIRADKIAVETRIGKQKFSKVINL